jgi:cytoskeleton protein RodZ
MGHLTDLPTKGNGAMGAFGDRLRREREMRSITLDEISESTKISRRHLEALEGEHFDQLPGGVFNKGFVRAYAHFLGIDEDQAVADYSAASNEQPDPEDKFPLEIHAEPNRELNPRRSNLPMAFAAAALAGVLVGYFFWVKSRPHSNEAVEPSHAASTTAQQAEPAKASSPAEVTTATPSVAQRSAAPAAPTNSERPVPAAAQVEKKASDKKFFVVIKAKEDSWISIVADGHSVVQMVLAADRQKLVKAARQIVLRTGNAGGIEVSFNGKSLGALGNENEPRTLTFSATGLVQ